MNELITCFFDDDSIEYSVQVRYDILISPNSGKEVLIHTVRRRDLNVFPVSWELWNPPGWFDVELDEQCLAHSRTVETKFEVKNDDVVEEEEEESSGFDWGLEDTILYEDICTNQPRNNIFAAIRKKMLEERKAANKVKCPISKEWLGGKGDGKLREVGKLENHYPFNTPTGGKSE